MCPNNHLFPSFYNNKFVKTDLNKLKKISIIGGDVFSEKQNFRKYHISSKIEIFPLYCF